MRLGTSLYNQAEGNCVETLQGIYGWTRPDILDHRYKCPRLLRAEIFDGD